MASDQTEPLLQASIGSITATTHRRFFFTSTQIIDDLLRHLETVENGPSPASNASIDALAVADLTEDCAICLDEELNEEAREMPCKHKFHKNCIEKWLKMNGNCPICRFQMPPEETSCGDDDKYQVGSDDEVRGRVTVVFVSTRRFGSSEAEGPGVEDLEWIS